MTTPLGATSSARGDDGGIHLQVARLAGLSAATEPEVVVAPYPPDRGDVWSPFWPHGGEPEVVRAGQAVGRPCPCEESGAFRWADDSVSGHVWPSCGRFHAADATDDPARARSLTFPEPNRIRRREGHGDRGRADHAHRSHKRIGERHRVGLTSTGQPSSHRSRTNRRAWSMARS